jgi:hypothetical protein
MTAGSDSAAESDSSVAVPRVDHPSGSTLKSSTATTPASALAVQPSVLQSQLLPQTQALGLFTSPTQQVPQSFATPGHTPL